MKQSKHPTRIQETPKTPLGKALRGSRQSVSNNVALLPRLERAMPAKALSVQQATLDDHSKVVPLLPIPNRTVKHLSADDS